MKKSLIFSILILYNQHLLLYNESVRELEITRNLLKILPVQYI